MSNTSDPSSELKNGWACVINANWDPKQQPLPKGLVPGLKVEKGQEVWVLRINQGFGFVHRPEGDTWKRGWVFLSVITKGVQRVDPLPIELPRSSNVGQAPVSQANSQPQDTLHAALRGLWVGVKQDEANITQALLGMSEMSKSIFFHRRSGEYADQVNRCITPRVRQLIGSGNFTIEQLKALPKVSTHWPRRPGIYIIIYNEFGGRWMAGQMHWTAFYIGRTINFQSRLRDHEKSIEMCKTSSHYSLAAKSDEMVMIPLVVQNTDDVSESFLDVAEFSMVCLLRSWYTVLFSPSGPSVVGSYSGDFAACLTFNRIMDQVRASTGWNPARSYGLNWETPIFKHPRVDEAWTSWYNESKGVYVYRTRRVVLMTHNIAGIQWNGDIKIVFPFQIARDAGFVHGQAVHVIVEVCKSRNGEYHTHPMRLARFPPEIGRNPETEKLKSLALMLQWLPEGETNWKQYYIERQRLYEVVHGNNDRVLQVHRTGMALLCDVEKTWYQNGPNWLHPTPATKVCFLRYDHLNQKRVLEVVQRRTIPWPRDNTMQENTQRLLQMFPPAQNPDTRIGARPQGFLPHPRTLCDMCLSRRNTDKCDYDPVDHSCSFCRPLNRVCTWSRVPRPHYIMDMFVYGERLEELGTSVNVSRNEGSLITTLAQAPFDPAIEAEEHTQLTGNQAAGAQSTEN
ncbi:hypothetical protein NW768_004392 [Fusarium equiseti]|uniref:Zn(2)-C6 fungal-type domain-containing protein n=1 Tax=Fusarium equiseti TaxID=61235 RepID=A0ABQ8RG64_FUSEQ|nr:hypothetical protein NW768_004392 [Fusarium equiseti]